MLHALFTLALVPLPVDSKDAVRLPNTPQPSFVVVRAVEGSEITVLQFFNVVVPITVQKNVVVNGKVETVTEIAYRQESRISERKFDLTRTPVYNGAGKKLSSADARKQFKIGDTVLLSENGQPVDPIYLRAIRRETLIFVMPQAGIGPVPPKK